MKLLSAKWIWGSLIEKTPEGERTRYIEHYVCAEQGEDRLQVIAQSGRESVRDLNVVLIPANETHSNTNDVYYILDEVDFRVNYLAQRPAAIHG